MTTKGLQTSSATLRLVLVQAGVIAAALAWVYAANLEFISGDPLEYQRRMRAMFSGQVPYVDVTFEHFPLMLAPMSMSWVVGGFQSAQAFRVAWVVLTAGALVATTLMFQTVVRSEGDRLALVWLAVSFPLTPLLVFRTEPWVVVPVVASSVSLLRGQSVRSGVYAFLGAAAKGWPALLNLGIWRRGWRKSAAIGTAMAFGLILVMTMLPGFIAGRSFSGLHSESTGGALWGLLDGAVPGDVVLESAAGAMYVNAPLVFAVPGVAVAATLLIALARSWRTEFKGLAAAALASVGTCVAAFLLVSPLQSSQFVYWLLPFVVLAGDRTTRVLAALAGLLATASVATFEALASLEPWWFGTVLLRHGLVAAIGLRLAWAAGRAEGRRPARKENG